MHAIIQTQHQRNTEYAHFAQQNMQTSQGNTGLTGVVHTDRNFLTRSQIVNRVKKSNAGNSKLDINKEKLRQEGANTQAPRMTQKRNIQCVERDYGTSLRRLVTGNESVQNATAPASVNPYEWHIIEDCHLMGDSDIGNQCFQLRSRYVSDERHYVETGITVETIGKGEICRSMYVYPTLVDVNILQDVIDRHYSYDFFHGFAYSSMLTTPFVCEILKISDTNKCKLFTFEDPVAQIDQFLRSELSSDKFRKVVVTDAETIEAWAARSQLLRENNVNAIALRQKDWKALHTKLAIGLGVAGSVVGLAAIGGITIRCRDKIVNAAGRLKTAMKSCSLASCWNPEDDEDQENSTVIDGANRLQAIQLKKVEISSASSVDSLDLSTLDDSDFETSSSSSSEKNIHQNGANE